MITPYRCVLSKIELQTFVFTDMLINISLVDENLCETTETRN